MPLYSLLCSKSNELKAGDVLLIALDFSTPKYFVESYAIRFLDQFSSNDWNSPASHTVLFLGERNGNRWYLDNTMGHGTVIIDERTFLKKYSHREMFAAALAQPLNEHEGKELWKAAHELGVDRTHTGLIDRTNYGLFGGDNFVCSEASRWALVRAGRRIPESTGHSAEIVGFSVKKQIAGVTFGPADFYELDQYFVVTPLTFKP